MYASNDVGLMQIQTSLYALCFNRDKCTYPSSHVNQVEYTCKYFFSNCGAKCFIVIYSTWLRCEIFDYMASSCLCCRALHDASYFCTYFISNIYLHKLPQGETGQSFKRCITIHRNWCMNKYAEWRQHNIRVCVNLCLLF